MEIAATRRGSVTPINRFLVNPASYKNCGTCVVFPDPVSPAIIKTSLFRTASIIMSSSPIIGNFERDSVTSGVRYTGTFSNFSIISGFVGLATFSDFSEFVDFSGSILFSFSSISSIISGFSIVSSISDSDPESSELELSNPEMNDWF